MGGIMDFVMLAVMIGGGAFVWINKDEILAGLKFGPGPNTGPDCVASPDDPGCTTGDDTGNGGNPDDCKNIYNGSCNTECSGGGGTKCDACKEACGDGGGSSGGGSSGGSSSCSQLCKDHKCSEYDDNCTAGCSACKSGGGSSGGSSGGGSNSCNSVNDCPTCGGGASGSRKCTNGTCGCSDGSSSSGSNSCKSKCSSKNLKMARESPCTCTSCGQITCGGSSGGSSGGCKSVQDCPKCNIGGTCRHCSSGKCGCWDKCSGFAESRFDDLVFPMSMDYNYGGR